VTNTLAALPFALLLLSIAILPMAIPHLWEKNKTKAIVILVLALPVLIFLRNDLHALAHSGVEYLSFVTLLSSLFITTGGINLSGDLKATPLNNTLFLFTGAVLASIIGTTGASMLLIRPLLQTNSQRKNTAHITVFFIFIVSNIGGLLSPIGDPPLFLGFLKGVPFFWTLKLFPIWALCIGSTLLIFYCLDTWRYNNEESSVFRLDEQKQIPLKITGSLNFIFLLGIVLAVFLPTPWRELVMLLCAIISFKTTHQKIRAANQFSFEPIKEISILFAGIFITMIPALEILKNMAPTFGLASPLSFFWATGIMSSLLDNAPAYLCFLTIAQSLPVSGELVAGINEKILMAISAGSVLMGALTYIGNGPNFMVKAIADQRGFKNPSFFGYMFYASITLLPVFALVTILFFK